ncbi:hypothetical protein VCHA53O466_50415 [Vibrio chagasii]|nr:hypothetical protein VCHA53O466_50415 [Vibrio chagasii]
MNIPKALSIIPLSISLGVAANEPNEITLLINDLNDTIGSEFTYTMYRASEPNNTLIHRNSEGTLSTQLDKPFTLVHMNETSTSADNHLNSELFESLTILGSGTVDEFHISASFSDRDAICTEMDVINLSDESFEGCNITVKATEIK